MKKNIKQLLQPSLNRFKKEPILSSNKSEIFIWSSRTIPIPSKSLLTSIKCTKRKNKNYSSFKTKYLISFSSKLCYRLMASRYPKILVFLLVSHKRYLENFRRDSKKSKATNKRTGKTFNSPLRQWSRLLNKSHKNYSSKFKLANAFITQKHRFSLFYRV